MQVNISGVLLRGDLERQLVVQVLGEGLNEVIGRLVAAMDEWIMASQRSYFRVVFPQWGDQRIVLPELIHTGSYVGQEFTRIAGVQVPHGRRQHQNVAGTLMILEY